MKNKNKSTTSQSATNHKIRKRVIKNAKLVCSLVNGKLVKHTPEK